MTVNTLAHFFTTCSNFSSSRFSAFSHSLLGFLTNISCRNYTKFDKIQPKISTEVTLTECSTLVKFIRERFFRIRGEIGSFSTTSIFVDFRRFGGVGSDSSSKTDIYLKTYRMYHILLDKKLSERTRA